ncbi:MAG: L-2-hydroxyglutarate oxidase [Anaerolineales bacterium]
MPTTDILIIGGGIVGLAAALRISARRPEALITIVEKERQLAAHQTGHNSGVLHSGIYYKPGSLKASNCRAGKQAMEAFCAAEGIPFDVCGKVIVAVDEAELPALQAIYERGQANGVRCEIIGPARLRELEPHAAGVQAIHVPEAGIVDYRQVCERMAARLRARGHRFVLGARVTDIHESDTGVIVGTASGEYAARRLINCTGLHSDRTMRLAGQAAPDKIVPFRGEYYELKPHARYLVRNLIYPVPDRRFPFLGVHFTRLIGGGVECGPNAVLAFAREGYRKTDLNLRDLAETLTYPGFLRMAGRYWKMGLGEMWRSFSKRAFVKALQRLLPEITADQLQAAPAGVRAQAVAPDGNMRDDFVIRESRRAIHLINAPSPAATASLSIGEVVADTLAAQLTGD